LSSVFVKNNIFYLTSFSNNAANVFYNMSHDYNWFYANWQYGASPSTNIDSTLTASEDHDQLGESIPFTNFGTEDFSITAATDTGYDTGLLVAGNVTSFISGERMSLRTKQSIFVVMVAKLINYATEQGYEAQAICNCLINTIS